MQQNQSPAPAGKSLVLCSILLNAVAVKQGFIAHPGWYVLSAIAFPLLLASIILERRQ
jgi:uncharacterized membrane protein YhdT